MKYISFLLLLTISTVKAFSQLSYTELDDLNSLCNKEDFEATKTFLKIKGYEIYTDNENYDHGRYFVLAEIQAKKKISEYKSKNLKGTGFEDWNNIYDKIEITFNEYDDNKELEINQSFTTDNLLDISYSRKFGPLFQWLYQDWDYVRDENLNKDSIWEKGKDSKINSDSYKIYFSSKKFTEKDGFGVTFRKNDFELGEKKEYMFFYGHRDFSKIGIPDMDYYDLAVILRTIITKGQNILNANENMIAFPLLKSGSSYLIKIKFGNIIKTYLLDSGASDMTLDNDTYKYLKATHQLKIENNLTKREYSLADGSKVQYNRVQIPTFSINNIIVKNINAVLVENGKPLLLGKSFLDSFKSWKVDNKTNTLIVEVF